MCSAKACWKLVILAPNTFLTALNYHNIADLYFDDSRYTRAGTYYDSTLVNYKKNLSEVKALKPEAKLNLNKKYNISLKGQNLLNPDFQITREGASGGNDVVLRDFKRGVNLSLGFGVTF